MDGRISTCHSTDILFVHRRDGYIVHNANCIGTLYLTTADCPNGSHWPNYVLTNASRRCNR
eukprot:scaffold65592_cov54-Cyclotella_meneghiniana.AAC.2